MQMILLCFRIRIQGVPGISLSKHVYVRSYGNVLGVGETGSKYCKIKNEFHESTSFNDLENPSDSK